MMNRGQYTLAEKLVENIHANFQGFHPGFRGVHAAGRFYAATFKATPEAKRLSRAVHFQGEPVPATVRHSHRGSGNPVGPCGAPSMTVRFYLPNGTHTDLIALSFPLFPASTPEETLALMEAVKPDTVNGSPNIEKMRAFAAARPGMAHAIKLIMAMPSSMSFAQTTYHALHAFRFVNAAGDATYARYHWVPLAGEASQTPEELASRPDSFFYDELESRLAKAPVQFDLVLQLAGEGDSTVDPSSPWPDARPRVSVGCLEITRQTTLEEIGDPVMMHDPTRLTDGIEASDDPILAARRGIYELSAAQRTGGWKGRQAALERGGCPFLGELKAPE